uniref:Retrotransposon protein, putative, unclassified n=2 Tax=Oryza sativa subsp. japonica TaxID=39947 RepID=Q10NI0_ORYSJ|nr:hypothetical protein [Oryza sativa Japonica Group]AAP06913.1 hypothetical protein [Oryza sativa Japonica Group]ABF95182.1 retrotransposon protein, putative, unclassified [Oryza sativa Japonica Group]
MAEPAKARDLSPSMSGDDGEPNPRRRARTPPPPPRQSPRREKALERAEGSATSTSTGGEEGRRDGERRLLVYRDGSTPQGALQAAGALLRHPPVAHDPESPAQRWLDDVAKLVMTARQRLDAGGRSSATKASGAATTGSASSRRRARRAAAAVRHSAATPTSTPSTREDLRGGPDARTSIERRRNDRRAAHTTEGASSSRVSPHHGRGDQPSVPPVGGRACGTTACSKRSPPRSPRLPRSFFSSRTEWLARRRPGLGTPPIPVWQLRPSPGPPLGQGGGTGGGRRGRPIPTTRVMSSPSKAFRWPPERGGLRATKRRKPTLPDLGYLEERRWRAALRAARYQQSLRRYHQRHVRARSLCVDDLVLRRVQTRAGLSKLSPMWEGPYRVIGVPRPGSVRLATGDGTELPNPWNIEHLRRFYP